MEQSQKIKPQDLTLGETGSVAKNRTNKNEPSGGPARGEGVHLLLHPFVSDEAGESLPDVDLPLVSGHSRKRKLVASNPFISRGPQGAQRAERLQNEKLLSLSLRNKKECLSVEEGWE